MIILLLPLRLRLYSADDQAQGQNCAREVWRFVYKSFRHENENKHFAQKNTKYKINNEINHPKEKEYFRNENCYLECQWHQII